MRRFVFAMVAALGVVGCGDKGTAPPVTQAPEPLCATSSTCQARVYCEAKQNCRCIKSAEGDIRCGSPPSCSIKNCTKSSDCADLGPGYFCDTPNSGCCGDTKQRCIGPCTGETCPASRICVGKCCAEGETCVSNKCAPRSGRDGGTDGPMSMDGPTMMSTMPITTNWSGGISSQGNHPVPVKFRLVDTNGSLRGQMFVEDPKTKQFLIDAQINGARSGNSAQWSTSTDLIIRGTFSQRGDFVGTIQFPTDGADTSHTSHIELRQD